MKKSGKNLILLLCLCFFNSIITYAQNTNKKDSLTIYQPPKREESFYRNNKLISKKTGRPLTLFNVNYKVTPGEPIAMAKQYLNAQKDTLGLSDTEVKSLQHVFTRKAPTGNIVRFMQTYKGLRVGDKQIMVFINNKNEIDFVRNEHKKINNNLSVIPKISETNVLTITKEYFNVDSVKEVNSSLIIHQLPNDTFI